MCGDRGISGLSPQSYYKPKTALKIALFKKSLGLQNGAEWDPRNYLPSGGRQEVG